MTERMIRLKALRSRELNLAGRMMTFRAGDVFFMPERLALQLIEHGDAGRTDEPSVLEELVSTLDQNIGLPGGFFVRLLTASSEDWSFVVMLNALAETVVAQSLLAIIDRPEVEATFRRLGHRLRVDMAADLKAITPSATQFLQALGDLRNMLAHDVTVIAGFTLLDLFANPPKRLKPLRLVGPHLSAVSAADSGLPSGGTYRFAMWLRMLDVLTELHVARESERQRVNERLEAAIAERRVVEQQLLQKALLGLMSQEPPEGTPGAGNGGSAEKPRG